MLIGWLLIAHPAGAQVRLDGTIGSAAAGLVESGIDELGQPDTYLIHDGLGEQVGSNLFHSFEQFDIGTDEVATFMSNSPAPIDNILARVTAGSGSRIHGTLRSTIPNADLFLMNPAGVVFGEGSSLDLPASLHVTTADYLKHSDGLRFPGDPGADTILAMAPVEAFGFLGSEVGNIEVDRANLGLAAGERFSLVGGDVLVRGYGDNVPPDASGSVAGLTAPSGQIDLIAVQSPGELPLDGDMLVDIFEALGDVRLDELAGVSTSGVPGGQIRMRGENLIVLGDRDAIRFSTVDSTSLLLPHPGTAIDLRARNSVDLRTAQVQAFGFQGADAGDLFIEAEDVNVAASLVTTTSFDGTGGSITIQSKRFLATDSGTLWANGQLTEDGALMNASVKAGEISIDAESVELRNGGQLKAENRSGAGGRIVIRANDLVLADIK
jgi:filamentous hemagglutinin family protein